jgi:APA family basic amino acid/polyamine antiporter
LWVTFASGYQVVYQALVVILVGLVLYAFLNARRQRLGEADEPKDFITDAPVGELAKLK